MNHLSPQWLQHYYREWSDETLRAEYNRVLMFETSIAELHMLKTEMERRGMEVPGNEGNPRAV